MAKQQEAKGYIHLSSCPADEKTKWVLQNGSRGEGSVDFDIPLEEIKGHVNNTRQSYNFKFNGLFDMKASQEEVFDGIGSKPSTPPWPVSTRPALSHMGKQVAGKPLLLLVGPNATLTVALFHGPCRTYSASRSKTQNGRPRCTLSYMEIYNETAYDLLDPSPGN